MRRLLFLFISIFSGFILAAHYPAQLPSSAAISCVSISQQVTVYVFEIATRSYGVDLPDFRKLTPAEQLDATSRVDYYDMIPRLFPRSSVQIDRSQIPVKLVFQIPRSFTLEIDIANPQVFIGGTKYFGWVEFSEIGPSGSSTRIVQLDCIQGARGPLSLL